MCEHLSALASWSGSSDESRVGPRRGSRPSAAHGRSSTPGTAESAGATGLRRRSWFLSAPWLRRGRATWETGGHRAGGTAVGFGDPGSVDAQGGGTASAVAQAARHSAYVDAGGDEFGGVVVAELVQGRFNAEPADEGSNRCETESGSNGVAQSASSEKRNASRATQYLTARRRRPGEPVVPGGGRPTHRPRRPVASGESWCPSAASPIGGRPRSPRSSAPHRRSRCAGEPR